MEPSALELLNLNVGDRVIVHLNTNERMGGAFHKVTDNAILLCKKISSRTDWIYIINLANVTTIVKIVEN